MNIHKLCKNSLNSIIKTGNKERNSNNSVAIKMREKNMKKMNKEVQKIFKESEENEIGSARITLELTDSKITMYHSNVNGLVLRSWDAKLGDWGKMFDSICETFSDNTIVVDGPLWGSSRPGIRTLNELKSFQERRAA